jgi:diguanylate cyclase (GGDEF)-like protein
MPDPALKVLIVDRSPHDAELALISLRRAGMFVAGCVASDESEFRTHLDAFDADVILCELTFSGFGGVTALRIAHEVRTDVPVVFLLGAIDEERAVAAAREATTDYVFKANLTRLPGAVERAVRDARARCDLKAMLQASEAHVGQHAQRLANLWRIAGDPLLRTQDRLQAMLNESALALRTPHRYQGRLVRQDGDSVVVLAITNDEDGSDSSASHAHLGDRISTALSSITSGLRTQYWDARTAAVMPPLALVLGWHSAITTRFSVGDERFALTFGASVEASFEPADVTYVEVLARSFADELGRLELERSLHASEARARRHAHRLESLWRIANEPSLQGADRIAAMLRESASAIRPSQLFRGIISRVVDDALLVLYVTPTPDDQAGVALRYPVGTRMPISSTVAKLHSRTVSWNDLAPDATRTTSELGWRSAMTTHFSATSSHYVLTFGSTESTVFEPDDDAYCEVLAASFANQFVLDDAERRLRRHSNRLESLLRILNNPPEPAEDLWIAMLRECASAIAPDQAFCGRFVRIDGDTFVREAVVDPAGYTPSLDQEAAFDNPTMAGSVVQQLLEAGGVRSWDDLRETFGSLSAEVLLGWRAVIGTSFTAGGKQYVLKFASDQPASEPFGPLEHAYIELLASFFARHVQEQFQFDRIAYQQAHDVLTGLYNRSKFRSLARSAALAKPRFAILLVGVDAFREINDAYGNMIGDALLVEIGAALQERASATGIVGRIAGDVFGIYLADAQTPPALLESARGFAEAFERPFSTGDREGREFVALSGSIGIAAAPRDGATVDDILSHADAALSVAKTRGPGSIVPYTHEMEGDPERRTTLRNDLAAAIAGNQLVLYFQPHVNIRDGCVTGCEALVRWQHPRRGLLLPAQFIPFAEETGLITGIDEWVMRHAFTLAQEFGALRPGFRLYFNLSGRQAGSASVVHEFVRAARAGIPIENLGIEITESDAMRDFEATRRICRALRRLGVRIAIDDFGTGYSSLSSLTRLPVHVIKIDRAFISGIGVSAREETIAETIILIAGRFGFTTLAEGVERPEEIAWLRRTSCEIAQGHAFSPALPAADFKTWLAARDAHALGGTRP